IGYEAGLIAADSILRLIHKREDSQEFLLVQIVVNGASAKLQKAIESELLKKTFTRIRLIDKLKFIARANNLFRLLASMASENKNSNSKQFSLRIEIEISLPVRDYKFIFSGVTLYETTFLARLLIENNDHLTSTVLKDGLDRIEHLYRSDGYDAAFASSVQIDHDTKQITIGIDEAIVRGIDVEGNTRSQDWLVRSYFPIKVGAAFSTKKAADGLDNLYGTDLFEQIMVDLVPAHNGARVKVRVKERFHTQLRLGWHWDDDYKSEQFVELLDDNIRGMGLEYLMHAQYADDRQKYFAQLKLDRIWFSYITARITGYHNRINKSIYDGDGREIDIRKERRTGFEISLGQQVKRFGTI
ncbi:MAG: POTRA domain-containing protein, partial [Candidatus Zixiibacteriota bacterium]